MIKFIIFASIAAILFGFLACFLVFRFFFSSRRRHTRSLCDWSSDVCSSDLDGGGDRGGGCGLPLVRETMLGKTELVLRHCLDHLVRLFGEPCSHALRFLHVESLQLIEEGHRSEEHTSELQSHSDLVCRLLLE